MSWSECPQSDYFEPIDTTDVAAPCYDTSQGEGHCEGWPHANCRGLPDQSSEPVITWQAHRWPCVANFSRDGRFFGSVTIAGHMPMSTDMPYVTFCFAPGIENVIGFYIPASRIPSVVAQMARLQLPPF